MDRVANRLLANDLAQHVGELGRGSDLSWPDELRGRGRSFPVLLARAGRVQRAESG